MLMGGTAVKGIPLWSCPKLLNGPERLHCASLLAGQLVRATSLEMSTNIFLNMQSKCRNFTVNKYSKGKYSVPLPPPSGYVAVYAHMTVCSVRKPCQLMIIAETIASECKVCVTKRRCFPCVHWIFIAMQKACCTYSTTICASVHVSIMLIAFTVPSLVVTSIVQTSRGTS